MPLAHSQVRLPSLTTLTTKSSSMRKYHQKQSLGTTAMTSSASSCTIPSSTQTTTEPPSLGFLFRRRSQLWIPSCMQTRKLICYKARPRGIRPTLPMLMLLERRRMISRIGGIRFGTIYRRSDLWVKTDPHEPQIDRSSWMSDPWILRISSMPWVLESWDCSISQRQCESF